MIKLLLEHIKTIDASIRTLMKNGAYFCLFILFIASCLLITYDFFYNSPDLYYIGLSVFQMGILFLAAFLGCGFAFNEIKNDI